MSEKEIHISSQINLNMDFIFLNVITKPRGCWKKFSSFLRAIRLAEACPLFIDPIKLKIITTDWEIWYSCPGSKLSIGDYV